MYQIFRTNAFAKDVKIMQKRSKDFTKLKLIIESLASNMQLSPKHKDHKLIGNWGSYRECHVEPDWLLIYRINNNTLELIRTGTHADLF